MTVTTPPSPPPAPGPPPPPPGPTPPSGASGPPTSPPAVPPRRGPLGVLFAIAAVALTLAALAYGVAATVNLLAVRTYRSTATFPLTDAVVLRGGNSSITLVADATDAIVVDSVVRRGLVDARPVATVADGALVLDGGCDQVLTSFCSVTVTVHVPRRIALRGHVSDGSLRADGLVGDVDLSVGDGSVRLTGVEAGTVVVSVADGRAELGLVNAPASIRLRSGDGSASVCLPADAPSYSVATHRADGRVVVDVPDDPRSSRPMELSTADGSVTARFCD